MLTIQIGKRSFANEKSFTNNRLYTNSMKQLLFTLLLLGLSLGMKAQEITSPNGNLKLSVGINEQGTPNYSLTYKGKDVIVLSRLGITTKEAKLTDNFRITESLTSEFDETWTPVWGEYEKVRNHYNELAITLEQNDKYQRTIIVRFRLYNDGLGFRYELPEQKHMNYLTVESEATQFCLTGNHTAYCIPGDYDTNEFAITTAPLTEIREGMKENLRKQRHQTRAKGDLSVQTPLLLKSNDGLYINIHEASLVNYAAMLLDVDEEKFVLTAHLTPDKLGICGYLQLPVLTPWRTIMVSDDARDILSSQLIYNLNEPCKITDTSWIKPQKFMGVWWEMFTGDGGTWAYSDYWKAKPGVTDYSKLTPNGRHAANTANVKRYIDFAAEHGIDALLVEGWNEGWEDWASYRKERHFLFNKPYPDFDIDEITRYAKEKGVNMIMHHETASNAADYERQLEDAFQYMVDHNYHAVKTGYVGDIIPRSEYHSSQWMNNHYIHVARTAAEYKIMIDSHEAVRPTGLGRTWPNWMTQESARGGEFESFGGNDPDHTCILPFTRLKGGPMDYTPGLFETKMSYYKGNNKSQAGTTLAKQLALYLTMPSPIQMVCDRPENYLRFPDAFQFIKDVAVDWSNSWYLEAEPGDYITVARQAKGRQAWFVGAITDEHARTATISFAFLPEGEKFIATVYADGKDADWKENPQSYAIRSGIVTSKSILRQDLAEGGGAAISIKPASKEELKKFKKLR